MLYHHSLGFPKPLRLPSGSLRLSYTEHARTAARSDRYGPLELPATLDTDTADVIEVETSASGAAYKVVYRVRYSDRLDLVLVVFANNYAVRSVWGNRRSDNHRTLDVSRYTRP